MTAATPERSGGRAPRTVAPASWGASWLIELSDASEGYGAQLRSRGRMEILEIVSGSGRIHARVVDRHKEVYGVDMEVRQLSSGERDDVISIAGTSGAILASLLDGSVPSVLVDTVLAMEINLFPTPSDLRISCDCDEWMDPCPHAAAALRAIAGSIDRDPFVLFELRGLPRRQMLDELRRLRAGAPVEAGAGFTDQAADPWEEWARRSSTVVDGPISDDDVVPERGGATGRTPQPGPLRHPLLDDPELGPTLRAAHGAAVERARELLSRELLRRRREPRPDPGDGT